MLMTRALYNRILAKRYYTVRRSAWGGQFHLLDIRGDGEKWVCGELVGQEPERYDPVGGPADLCQPCYELVMLQLRLL